MDGRYHTHFSNELQLQLMSEDNASASAYNPQQLIEESYIVDEMGIPLQLPTFMDHTSLTYNSGAVPYITQRSDSHSHHNTDARFGGFASAPTSPSVAIASSSLSGSHSSSSSNSRHRLSLPSPSTLALALSPRQSPSPRSRQRRDSPGAHHAHASGSYSHVEEEMSLSLPNDEPLPPLPSNPTEEQRRVWNKKRNTRSAKMSRLRKQIYTKRLEEEVENLKREKEVWRTRAQTLRQLFISHGIDYPPFEN
ncbi:hypothetical protein BDP27DRAFT_1321249 [Rhodocollybia butyracea]|uniref:BZIP domain-containing protein n=1 Tax=Rhodocollybia butyracea TaxID=206335 RepID=A0A9P5PTC7_9AGAR|nr:hypothetical protein BDP27DRAFT_1321249 [Rhodocollybia butyracea]